MTKDRQKHDLPKHGWLDSKSSYTRTLQSEIESREEKPKANKVIKYYYKPF